jgi:hypothetical protein
VGRDGRRERKESRTANVGVLYRNFGPELRVQLS